MKDRSNEIGPEPHAVEIEIQSSSLSEDEDAEPDANNKENDAIDINDNIIEHEQGAIRFGKSRLLRMGEKDRPRK